jgi:hypothetical protein
MFAKQPTSVDERGMKSCDVRFRRCGLLTSIFVCADIQTGADEYFRPVENCGFAYNNKSNQPDDRTDGGPKTMEARNLWLGCGTCTTIVRCSRMWARCVHEQERDRSRICVPAHHTQNCVGSDGLAPEWLCAMHQ